MSMLTLKVEAQPGLDLRDVMIGMARLARKTDCMIELKANDRTFWAYPDDTDPALRDAFDRLYQREKYIHTRSPVLRPDRPGGPA